MLWLKAFHLVFVVTWFAGLFYLPRLFVYHVAATDSTGRERFALMERRLFVLMSLGGLLALAFGIALLVRTPAYLALDWMRLKLVLVALLLGYHVWCYRLMAALAQGRPVHSQPWYRWFNEIPTVFLVAIVLLAVLRPDF
jgi:protoporphyrinogen IX oxidase